MQLLGTASDLAIGVKTLGQIEKTITGLSYAAFPDLRRGALIMHNKQEGHNALKAEIAFGNKGIYRLSVEGAVHVRHACLELMAALVILHNAVHMQAAWNVLRRRGVDIPAEHIRHIYPTATHRINWIGDLIFADSRDLRFPLDRVHLVGE